MENEAQKKPLMTQDHLKVLDVIKTAKNKYISSTEIIAILTEYNMTDRKLKQIISELVNDYEIPIGSSSVKGRKGYFYCENDYDFYVAKRSLTSRVDAITGRLDVLEKCHERLTREA